MEISRESTSCNSKNSNDSKHYISSVDKFRVDAYQHHNENINSDVAFLFKKKRTLLRKFSKYSIDILFTLSFKKKEENIQYLQPTQKFQKTWPEGF